MASGGIAVVFKRVRRAATKAKPYLVPAGPVGQAVMLASFKNSIATLKFLNQSTITRAAGKAVRLGAFAARAAARRKVLRKSGTLWRGLNPRKVNLLLWNVGTKIFYARFVEEGTRAGTRNGPYIYPKTKKALAFRWRNAPPAVRAKFRGRGRRRR